MMYVSGYFNQIRTLAIRDINGSLMLQCHGVSSGDAVDVSSLPPSVYLLTIETDKGTRILKLVKI